MNNWHNHSSMKGRARDWRRVCSGTAAAMITNLSMAAAAQDQEVVLEELVVTAPLYVSSEGSSATKLDIPLVEVPQSVTVISRDQIELLAWQNIEQTVRYTAGVVGENFGADERYDWFTLRGFNPVQFIDGLRSPVASTSTTGIDLYGFESIEVLKGPASVMYGQVPPGGLVNLTSRRPRDEFSGELQVQYGTFDHRQVNGDITGPLDGEGKYQYRLSALARERDTQVDFIDSQRVFVAPAFAIQFAPGTRLTFLSYYQNDDSASTAIFLPSQGTRLPSPNGKIPVGRFISEPGFESFKREQYSVGYEFEHKANETWSFHQGLKYSELSSDQDTLYGGGLQADGRTLTRYFFLFDEDLEVLAVDNRAQAKFATGPLEHTMLIGLDYRDVSNVTGFAFSNASSIDVFAPVYGQPIGTVPAIAYATQKQEQTGLYLQDHIKLDRVVMTLSARHDWSTLATQKDEELSYRAGLNYVFDSGIAPYIGYAKSFQPSLGRDVRLRPFEPTTGEQVELGVKYDARTLPEGMRAFATIAVYELTQQNVTTPDPVNPGFNVQTGEARVWGAEFEAVGRFNERLSLNFSYSYTDSEVTRSNNPAQLGKELVRVPKNKVSMYGDYTFQTGLLAGFGLGAGVRYVDETYGTATNIESIKNVSTTLVDATLHYNIADWRIAVNANNLLDKEFVSNCGTVNSCFWGPVRTVYLNVGRYW